MKAQTSILLALLLLTFLPLAFPVKANIEGAGLELPFTHVPFIESFEGTWCPPCMQNMHPAFERLYEHDWNPHDHPVHIVEIHLGSYDPLTVDDGIEVASYYSVTGIPTYVVDGGYAIQVGASNPDSAYEKLCSDINSAGKRSVPKIHMLVSSAIRGRTLKATVKIYNPGSKEFSGLLTVYVVEDNVTAYSSVTGQDETFRFVLRKVLAFNSFTMIQPDSISSEYFQWGIPSSYNSKNIIVVAAIRDIETKFYIQSACSIEGRKEITVERHPEKVSIGEEITIVAKVKGVFEKEIETVKLQYSFNGETNEMEMTRAGPLEYRATIPGFDTCGTLTYKVTVYTTDGKSFSSKQESVEVMDDIPPTIDSIKIIPSQPQPGEEFEVYVFAHDEGGSGISTVEICYYVDDTPTGCLMAQQVNETAWKATIPGQEGGCTVKLNVTVMDASGNAVFQLKTVQILSPEEHEAPEQPAPSMDMTILGLLIVIIVVIVAIIAVIALKKRRKP